MWTCSFLEGPEVPLETFKQIQNTKNFLNSFENSFESFIAIQSNNYFSDIVAVLYDTFTLYTKLKK